MTELARQTPPDYAEYLPDSVHPSWHAVLKRLRDAHAAGDKVETDRACQYGIGFVNGLHAAGLVKPGDRDELRQLLLSPRLRR